ncbi:MAG: DNA mismatch repair endonuclease MutL [Candidatus Goldbacteria bacterium]|nr:DNA mismatch repair endonuclease MutL [Candidatus Goldiibacteriota bacterium]
MGIIQVLPDSVINQIAAGEVVTRPASCVKEILENSIDAGAQNITINILSAGKKLIEIKDDGCGMDEEDCERAFLRHATSKIKNLDDLNYIETMGFRGEALAAIASVSRIEIMTKIEKDNTGTLLYIEAGKIKRKEKVAINKGTVIKVMDLFYNTPARLKFLKTNYTEELHIIDTVLGIALVNTGISFKLIMDGKEILYFPKDAVLKERIRLHFGKEISDNLIEINNLSDNIKIHGYVGKPQIFRNDRNVQFLFVNKRIITSKRLNYAIYDGYSTHLMKGKHPVSFILIDINPSYVDVNVHPAKAEVKFKDEGKIYNMMKQAIVDALNYADLSISQPINSVYEVKKNIEESIKDYFVNEHGSSTGVLFKTKQFEVKKQDKIEVKSDIKKHLFVRVIGQLNKTYIIGEDDLNLVIIDQHAAHEKVLYEKIITEINQGNVRLQELLIPEIIEVNQQEKKIIENNKDIFKKMGFEIEQFGERQFKITTHPVIIRTKASTLFVKEAISLLSEKETVEKEEILKNLTSTLACRAALKAGDELTNQEIEALLKDYFEINTPYSCPHGRPAIAKISFYEVEKMFKRRG